MNCRYLIRQVADSAFEDISFLSENELRIHRELQLNSKTGPLESYPRFQDIQKAELAQDASESARLRPL